MVVAKMERTSTIGEIFAVKSMRCNDGLDVGV